MNKHTIVLVLFVTLVLGSTMYLSTVSMQRSTHCARPQPFNDIRVVCIAQEAAPYHPDATMHNYAHAHFKLISPAIARKGRCANQLRSQLCYIKLCYDANRPVLGHYLHAPFAPHNRTSWFECSQGYDCTHYFNLESNPCYITFQHANKTLKDKLAHPERYTVYKTSVQEAIEYLNN